MKVGAYSTLIVAVILGVVLTTSLMVPVIANVDSGQTEERLVPMDVTNGELYNARDNAPDGIWVDSFADGILWGNFNIDYYKLYVDNTYIDGTYTITGSLTSDSSGYILEIYSSVGYTQTGSAQMYISNELATQYGISSQGFCQIMYKMYIGGGRIEANAIIGNSGNEEDRPSIYITIIPQGVIAYYGIPDLTTNGYRADQVMLESGLTTSATTQAYYITGFTPNNAQVVDKITHNNALVGYQNNDESQPVYKFNANKDIYLFAPIDDTFLGVERVDYTNYYNVKDVTIYEKKDVPVDSPIKWILAIIPVMVLVGIVVFVINTQIVQKRD